MKKYGRKARLISMALIIIGVIFIICSILLMGTWMFESLISLSSIFLFSGIVIYFVIYRQFEKIEEIADEIEMEQD